MQHRNSAQSSTKSDCVSQMCLLLLVDYGGTVGPQNGRKNSTAAVAKKHHRTAGTKGTAQPQITRPKFSNKFLGSRHDATGICCWAPVPAGDIDRQPESGAGSSTDWYLLPHVVKQQISCTPLLPGPILRNFSGCTISKVHVWCNALTLSKVTTS